MVVNEYTLHACNDVCMYMLRRKLYYIYSMYMHRGVEGSKAHLLCVRDEAGVRFFPGYGYGGCLVGIDE